ncbi:unnamed protein product [Rhizoctonia solani]|uniref:Uncharacterized protein n=1 Tax=Rhizoctonia solani TaxID=456999 RepID=A0A8H3GU18_9AGAM|nr:unnamed protein product [Rhizoctonia solani]
MLLQGSFMLMMVAATPLVPQVTILTRFTLLDQICAHVRLHILQPGLYTETAVMVAPSPSRIHTPRTRSRSCSPTQIIRVGSPNCYGPGSAYSGLHYPGSHVSGRPTVIRVGSAGPVHQGPTLVCITSPKAEQPQVVRVGGTPPQTPTPQVIRVTTPQVQAPNVIRLSTPPSEEPHIIRVGIPQTALPSCLPDIFQIGDELKRDGDLVYTFLSRVLSFCSLSMYKLNNILARATTVRSSTMLQNSNVPAAVFCDPTPAPATNIQVINPTDAGYSLTANTQATRPVQIPTRQPFNLIYGPRPIGTAGRQDFPLKELLGLNTYEYLLCLKTMRNVSYSCGIDDTLALSYQEDHKLFHAYNKFIEVLPEFKGFQDRYWAPRAFMYVTLKSSSVAWRRNNPESAAARSAARAMEKTALKAAALSKKVKRPRGRPKGKGKAKNNTAAPPATVENLAINLDEVADDFGNMSLEPEIAGGLANMSIDARANDDDDYVAPNQPFFYSDLSSGPYATSTPLVPTRLAQTVDQSALTAIGDTRQHAVGTGHIHLPNQTYAPHSTPNTDCGTNEHSISRLNGADGLTQATGIPNCLPNTSIASARAFDSSLTHNSSSHPPPIPHISRPPPIPYGSRPPSIYSNSFSQSVAPNSDSLPPSTNSRDPTPNTASHPSSRDTTVGSIYLPDTTRVEMARPVIVDLGSHASFAQNTSRTQTNSPALLRSRAPASIVALLGDTRAGAYTQAAEESNHPLAVFDEGELSDAPSATASNKPVVSDIETTATTTAPKKAPKKNGRKKARD